VVVIMLANIALALLAFSPTAPVARRSLAASPCVHTMAAIAATDVKTLRGMTGAGMMDCKTALKDSDGDMEKAAELLRAKGLAAAGKRADKATSEGLIEVYVHTGSRLGVMVEVRTCADTPAARAHRGAAGRESRMPGAARWLLTRELDLARVVRARDAKVNCETDFVAKRPEFAELAKSVAMQIAASPTVEFVSVDDIPADVRERERDLEMQSEDLAGKPDEIKAKMVDGRLNKILKTKCLMEQPFIKDPSQTMEQLLKATISTLGENIKVARFSRMELGA
jgi:elongation factor Ts